MNRLVSVIVLSFLPFLGWVSVLQAQTQFYQGKSIKIVVGYLAGDGYDLWARIVAPHMARQIPGNPRLHRAEHAGSGISAGERG